MITSNLFCPCDQATFYLQQPDPFYFRSSWRSLTVIFFSFDSTSAPTRVISTLPCCLIQYRLRLWENRLEAKLVAAHKQCHTERRQNYNKKTEFAHH